MISSWTRLWKEKKKVLYQLSAFGGGVSNSFFHRLRQNTKSSNSFKTPLGFGKYITRNELHWTFGTCALLSSSLKQVLVFHCVRNLSQWSGPPLCQVRPLMLEHRSPTGTCHTVSSVHATRRRVGKENHTMSELMHYSEFLLSGTAKVIQHTCGKK